MIEWPLIAHCEHNTRDYVRLGEKNTRRGARGLSKNENRFFSRKKGIIRV